MACWNIGLGSHQKWMVGNTIRDLMLQDEDIVELIGNKIYPIVAPEPKTGLKNIGDYIVYQRDKYAKEIVKQGVYADVCTVSVSCVCDNYDNACILASLVDNCLTGNHRMENNTIELRLEDASEYFDEGKFIETLVFKIR